MEDGDLWKTNTHFGQGEYEEGGLVHVIWHSGMSSVNASETKKCNWDFQRLQPLGKSVPSASSANPCPGDQSTYETTSSLLLQWSHWKVPSTHQHCLPLYPFQPKIKTNLGFLEQSAPRVTKHWSFLCFCFSSLISCLACAFSERSTCWCVKKVLSL